GGAIAGRLVGGDRQCIRGERLEVRRRPVLVVLHGRIRCLVKRRGDVQVRTLEDRVLPLSLTPLRNKAPSLTVSSFMPASRELQPERGNSCCTSELGERTLCGGVDRVN